MRTIFATSLIAMISALQQEGDTNQLDGSFGHNTFNFHGDIYGDINGYAFVDCEGCET